jgi:hypothetical protein
MSEKSFWKEVKEAFKSLTSKETQKAAYFMTKILTPIFASALIPATIAKLFSNPYILLGMLFMIPSFFWMWYCIWKEDK